jgi:prolyl-tRNA synthetase
MSNEVKQKSKQDLSMQESPQAREAQLGITVKKEQDLSEWYTQVVLKAELADYSGAKGFMAVRPYGYAIWEILRERFDQEIKKTGHQNAYFPTLIPESLLQKEAEHFAGFTPEVFWVTKAGDRDLQERLAVRPTSETIIHDAMKRWIRSWRDLPMLLNVWNSVLRAEIKSTKPFIRTTEFLWQEGHTAHATEEEAEKEVMEILMLYKKITEELFAVPVLIGKKSEKEKFVGAVYTTTLEAMMPDGKAVQTGTSHHLGQNFSVPFDIKYLGEDGGMHHVWQTSWGISWRLIGAMIMEHGDDKGLIIPPNVAPIQAIVIPILFSSTSSSSQVSSSLSTKGRTRVDKGAKEEEKEKEQRGGDTASVISVCREVKSRLENCGVKVKVDERENYTPGWKFNEWELKGVPLRIEVGPRDVAAGSVVLVRRDVSDRSEKKKQAKLEDLEVSVKETLNEIQSALLRRCEERLHTQISEASNFETLSKILEERGGFVKAPWCGSRECEDKVKESTGADIRVIPFDEKPKGEDKCVVCSNLGLHLVYFARAY